MLTSSNQNNLWLKVRLNFVLDNCCIVVCCFCPESKLKKLMSEIQSNFKCLGLLEPYCWKKGEACVIRGSDTLWYRGKVVELGGGTLQVSWTVFCLCV